MDKHLEIFQTEAHELLIEIEEVVLLVEQNPSDTDAINRLFRAVHTLKGSGGMFSLTDLVELSHDLEAVLDCVRSNKLAIDRELIDIILVSRDLLQALIGDIGAESSAELKAKIKEATSRLKKYLGFGAPEKIAKETIEEEKGAVVCADFPNNRTTFLYRIVFIPGEDLFSSGTDPSLLMKELRSLGRCREVLYTDKIPSLSDMDPSKCYLGWNIVLETDKGVNAIRDVFIFVEDGSRIDITDLDSHFGVSSDAPPLRLGDILVDRGDIDRAEVETISGAKIGERLVKDSRISPEMVVSSLEEQKAIAKRQENLKRENIRVPSEKLDALVNLVGELVTNQACINRIACEIDNPGLSASIEDANRLTDELRDVVLNVRMVPIGALFSQYKRLVRDLSKDLGKEIDLVTRGEDTELDKTVIDRLGEQVVHIIRNAIDHGVESPDEREKKGKVRRGTICLEAEHRGACVVIKIRDDGKGLNAEAIRTKAVKQGLIRADRDYSEKEIFRLIFAPGLSTASKVTDVSGRGVGMDVVLKGVESLRGTVEIASEPDRGTTLELFLPLTLAIIDGLLIEADKERYVIPLCHVEECLELTPETYVAGEKRNLIQVRGGTIPLIRLRQLFGSKETRGAREEAVVVGVGESVVAIVVDHIIGNHQTVIKSLKGMRHCSECISGATIMGDGKVALILDPVELIKLGSFEEKAKVSRAA